VSRKKKNQVKPPAFFQKFSKRPDGTWPQGAFYHGSRAGLLVLLGAAITLLFPSGTRVTVAPYALGDVATEDFVADVGFQIPRDSAEVASQQAEAAAAMPPVFEEDPTIPDGVEIRLNEFFDDVASAVEAGGRPAVERVLTEEDLGSLVEDADYFLDPGQLQAIRDATLNAVRQFSNLVLDSDDGMEVLGAGQIQVIRSDRSEISVDVEDLLWGRGFYEAAVEALPPSTPVFERTFRIFLIHYPFSPYEPDLNRTAASRAEASSAVQTTEGEVVAGEIIIRRGDQVGSPALRLIAAHQDTLRDQGLMQELGRDWVSSLGRFLLNLLLLGVFGLLLFFYRREVYESFRWVFLMAVLVFVYFLVGAGISWQGYPSELLPIAFVVLPVAILWDGRMALILAMVLGVLTGAQEPFNDFTVLAFITFGGGAAALSARAVRRRSQTWIFIALITLGNTLGIAAFGLMGDLEPGSIPLSILFAAMNATVSAILAMGFMPVFEWFTGITTDQTLLEWADPNRSLIKSLSLEASGTYAHTINVANLAEAAATAIGANGLLTRVGVYYHDVGKMLKPQYFVENQPGSRNPHDKLKPHTSATIVREHVTEGERMARDEGVPDIVARFIPEHHGTQLIGYFYEKAKEESEEEPDELEFRYPGPKPQSKETAIAMLADSIESATRAMQDPTPDRVSELVQTIFDGKIRDGQLSESPLTLREIDLIQKQFIKVISGMFHHRLDYPATRHITEAPKDAEEGEPELSMGEDRKKDPAAGAEEEQLRLTTDEDPEPSSPPDDAS
jgi:putative nucleotidyltransferase with HDIG domain